MSFTSHRKSRNRYQRALLCMEALEPRTLLSATPQFYTTPDVTPAAGAYDAAGNLWVFNSFSSSLDEVAPTGTQGTGSVQASIDLSNFGPISHVALGPNGHLYLADDNGGIDDVVLNGAASTVTYYPFANPSQSPTSLTVSNDGAVWFLTSNHTLIGRWTIATNEQFFTLPYSDSAAQTISANSDNSANTVWVGMVRHDGQVGAVNHALSFSFNGSAILTTVADAPIATNRLTAIAADDTGGAWAALANVSGTSTPSEMPDQVVHITSASVVSAPINIGASIGAPLNISSLAIDGDGNVWAGQLIGNQAFYIANNTANAVTYSADAFTTVDFAASPVTGEISILTATVDPFDPNPVFGIANITVESEVPPVQFQVLTEAAVSSPESTAISNFHLACFTAPAPTQGSYSAVINWSNGATTSGTVNVVSAADNLYEVVFSAPSNTFAVNGDFTGTVHIVDGAHVEAGNFAAAAHISDTPLVVGPFAAGALVNPNGHFVDLNLPITDDTDATASWFTATVNWGDDSTSTGLVVKDLAHPGRFFVVATHKYKGKKTTYTVDVAVTSHDDSGLVSTVHASGQVTL